MLHHCPSQLAAHTLILLLQSPTHIVHFFSCLFMDREGMPTLIPGSSASSLVVGPNQNAVSQEAVHPYHLCWDGLLSLRTVLGTFLIDYLGLKTTMSATRFAMSIMYSQFTDHTAMFAVIYGIFLCFGEVRPGSCLHLLAGRTSPAAIDGQMYAITAMVGKVGAVMGIWGTHTQRLF
ncbi:hypothetical protein F5141DRAFT_1065667 [Pisolithus sp. B1]|nr:hypothetical protein F5141DRAFT_1065667 [Pisolithus sp. B1]